MALLLGKALDFALTKAGKDSDFILKTEQKSIIEAVVCQKKGVLEVLPSGFSKSLVPQSSSLPQSCAKDKSSGVEIDG